MTRPVFTIIAGSNGCGKSTLSKNATSFQEIPLLDPAVIFDNSTDAGHILIGVGHAAFVHWVEPVPEWAAFLRE